MVGVGHQHVTQQQFDTLRAYERFSIAFVMRGNAKSFT